MKKLTSFIFIMCFIFGFDLQMLTAQDTFDELITLANKVKKRNYKLDEKEIRDLTASLNSLCEGEIHVNTVDFASQIKKYDELAPIDSIKVNYCVNQKNNMLLIPICEINFRTIGPMQKGLTDWVIHLGIDGMMKVMDPYQNAQNSLVQYKTNYLASLFLLAKELENPVEKKRCFAALDRMFEDIDLKKSESEWHTLSEYPVLIHTKPGEVAEAIKTLRDNEDDPEILNIVNNLMSKIEAQLGK